MLYFSKTDRWGPSSRYRIYQYLEGLEGAGVRVTVSPLFRRFYFRLVEWPVFLRLPGKAAYTLWRFAVRGLRLLTVGRYDGLVIEHQLFPYLPPWAERLLCALGKPFYVEFDDAIYLTALHEGKMRTLTRLAKGVIVGNRFLAEFAREQNREVHVVPTVLDLSRYAPKETYDPAGERFVVGWIGLRYNFPFLREVASCLPEGAVLRVVSSSRPDLPGVPLEFEPWSEEAEPAQIAGFDVGIMPLPDNEWARGKCGLKILQYMAAGVPVVASPVGINEEIIEDGSNGLLVSSPASWRNALQSLMESKALRERLGRGGRHTVSSRYTLAHGLNILIPLLKKD